MYPDDPVSNLNAALTAIDVGRLNRPVVIWRKTSDSAERTLAEAAIAMLENRLDEAEALLGKLSGRSFRSLAGGGELEADRRETARVKIG